MPLGTEPLTLPRTERELKFLSAEKDITSVLPSNWTETDILHDTLARSKSYAVYIIQCIHTWKAHNRNAETQTYRHRRRRMQHIISYIYLVGIGREGTG